MKSDSNRKRPKSSGIISLLFIIVLTVILIIFFMEKSSPEARIHENALRCIDFADIRDFYSALFSIS